MLYFKELSTNTIRLNWAQSSVMHSLQKEIVLTLRLSAADQGFHKNIGYWKYALSSVLTCIYSHLAGNPWVSPLLDSKMTNLSDGHRPAISSQLWVLGFLFPCRRQSCLSKFHSSAVRVWCRTKIYHNLINIFSELKQAALHVYPTTKLGLGK